ncbi:hypothetical protein ACIA8G_39790 [Lentzea sp. NPDC051213]|uniref:hypothetical protein n=1 Tax=Lentzea sp. NPDC051213 TaxID=3364126 RepID=UPI00378843AE
MKKTLVTLAVTGAALLALGGQALADTPQPIPPFSPTPIPAALGDEGDPPGRAHPFPIPAFTPGPVQAGEPGPLPATGQLPVPA